MASSPLKFGLTVCWIATSAVRPRLLLPHLSSPADVLSLTQLQYGFHIAALNSSAESIICDASHPDSRSPHAALGLPSCVHMSDAAFGTVTSAYTVGGLVGSLGAGSMIERWGRKGTAVRSALVIMLVRRPSSLPLLPALRLADSPPLRHREQVRYHSARLYSS